MTKFSIDSCPLFSWNHEPHGGGSEIAFYLKFMKNSRKFMSHFLFSPHSCLKIMSKCQVMRTTSFLHSIRSSSKKLFSCTLWWCEVIVMLEYDIYCDVICHPFIQFQLLQFWEISFRYSQCMVDNTRILSLGKIVNCEFVTSTSCIL